MTAAGKASVQKLATPVFCSRPTRPREGPPGPTTRSPRPSTSAYPPSPGCGNASLSRGWRPPWATSSRTGQPPAQARRPGLGPADRPGLLPSRRGRKQWTLQLLADKLVGLRVVDSISDETVRRVHPARSRREFVCAMEDMLEVYHRPNYPERPLVCLDETSRQLIGEMGQPKRRTARDFAFLPE